MKFLTLAFLLLTLALNAFAAETKVCVITTDVDAEKTDFFIETNSDGNLDSIRLYKTVGQEVVSDESLPVEKAIGEDIVASEREGRAIVIIKTSNFTAEKGGNFTLSILHNALKNTRISYNMKLSKTATGFSLTGPQGQPVNRLHLLGNRAPLINRVIGIKEVKASYVPAKK